MEAVNNNTDTKTEVKTVTKYSWHYYEREEQVDMLIESLNPKGQREKKLQENLRKVRDRLKLKKTKKVAP